MAIGDVVKGLSSIITGAFLTIQPGAGAEWIVHNIYHQADVELYVTDGSNDVKFDADSSFGAWTGMFFHLTNDQYLKVKNTNASSKFLGYDGVVSK